MPDASPPVTAGGRSLQADCAQCAALCCVAPAFVASADFAISKPAGQPCPNLTAEFGCSIHGRLRQRGFPGCSAYDCFGAGQQVTQVTFGGQDWRSAPQLGDQMFAVFAVMRRLHELLWHLGEAQALAAARPVRAELAAAAAATERLASGTPAELLALDLAGHWQQAAALLQRASELARAGAASLPGGAGPAGPSRAAGTAGAHPGATGPARSGASRAGPARPGADLAGASLAGADLAGRKLRGARLCGASLRGALLVGADLRQADLRLADLAGADLRGADLRGADLTGSLFLTRAQLDAATGDHGTRLPERLAPPASWLVAPEAS